MRFILILVLLNLLLPTTAHAERKNTDRSLTKPIEEIIISGRRPGPPLWQIENGENTLWVFAVVSTMPKSFEWDQALTIFSRNRSSIFH